MVKYELIRCHKPCRPVSMASHFGVVLAKLAKESDSHASNNFTAKLNVKKDVVESRPALNVPGTIQTKNK